MSRAKVTRLPGTEVTLGQAAELFLNRRDLADTTRATYAVTCSKAHEDLGADCRLVDLDAVAIERHLEGRYGSASPATYNRVRATLGSLFTTAARKGLIDSNPVEGIERRKPRKTKGEVARRRAIDYEALDALWTRPDIAIREKTLWRMLYETAARANEVLSLNVEDLDFDDRSAITIGKGGHAETIFWSSGTARLLPKLLDGRSTGPVFLTDRRALRPMPANDTDPATGHTRLSYRRAAEMFTEASGGWTLHQLRHSELTRLAESGVDIALLKAKSRHASIRSLERYVNPSEASVAKLTADHDPEARRSRR
ncbi:tyrosine-type recombinase/integrase [Actinospongicola halichondriae]|uniref:tyrosine-type recombinase/integrase n=1 Tax=Actinospongicola halichondriae TaxID=3236844 RepID=UPI003D594FD7